MTPVEVTRGQGPIVLGLPHTGTFVPPDIFEALNENGKALADTDWHVDRLYRDVHPEVTTVRATFHRYVIDANRAPTGESLYPGQNTTSLVPLTDFDGHDIWTQPPDAGEIRARCTAFHTPYHQALAEELARVRALHGVAILYDCHSIRSKIPFLFDGILPDFSIGTNSAQSCDAAIERSVLQNCEKATAYTHVSNGRFKGGWTTRHYGQPDQNQHAIQMELAQSTYLSEETAPWYYDTKKAETLRQTLSKILGDLHQIAPSLGAKT